MTLNFECSKLRTGEELALSVLVKAAIRSYHKGSTSIQGQEKKTFQKKEEKDMT